MTIVEVFDPAMCCSTGVCGPTVDPGLSRFAADLDWLAAQSVTVIRHNLAQEPGAFAAQPLVTGALQAEGEGVLPVVITDGTLVSKGRYPAREELAAWAGLAAPAADPFAYGAVVDELVAIAAAIAANCEPCLEQHVRAARRLGVTDADVRRAVATALRVKDTPARAVRRYADELLAGSATGAEGADGGACCGQGEPAPVAIGERPAPADSGTCC